MWTMVKRTKNHIIIWCHWRTAKSPPMSGTTQANMRGSQESLIAAYIPKPVTDWKRNARNVRK